MEYKVIRSRRKSLAIQVTEDGVVVRAPFFVTNARIEKSVRAHEAWIRRQIEILEEKKKSQPQVEKLSEEELKDLTKQAKKMIPERVEYYAKILGVSYGKITIRHQKTRWGSCSSKGNLNFNCLLMLTPPEVIDSIVVHELCHRKEMNHSKAFYAEVLRVYPEYKKWNKWLKEHGSGLMKRLS